MEALYSKLYDKYNDIKTKRMTEMDQLNKDQEVKFVKYVSAAEELIQYFKSDKEKLMSQVNDLRSELASARVSKECSEYQKLWIEESQKNRALSEEVERLQKLQQESSISIRKGNKRRQENTPQTISGRLFDSSTGELRRSKRGKLSETEAGGITELDSPQVVEVRQESAKGLHKQTVSHDTGVMVQKSECCTTIGRSGDEGTNCIYQTLIENLLGMKFSVLTQNGVRISAEHPSSGYSFSLTWLEKEDGKEVELQYNVVSLGTFERVAPEWMKEAIMFSTTMCPIFFERVSRVVKLYS